MNSSYSLLISKINEFIHKYYLNKLVRGILYAAALMLSLYITLLLVIYFGFPSVALKTTLFYAFIFISIVALIKWVLKPAWQYYRCERAMSHQDAAKRIGDYFPNINDHLLNTLQLQNLAQQHLENQSLILAGIEQKIKELKPIPFASAIRLGENRKNLKYLLIPMVVILSIALVSPTILREGNYSLVRYDEDILPPAPFDFIIENQSLTLNQGDDFILKVKLKGDNFPQDIYFEDGKNSYKLDKKDINHFEYPFQNLQKTKTIRLRGGGFYSKSHQIVVRPRPALIAIRADLIYPNYLKRKPEKLANSGDLLVPEGTKIRWALKTKNSESLIFILHNKSFQVPISDGLAKFESLMKESGPYQVAVSNFYSQQTDTLTHQIQVVKDAYPSIKVAEQADSLSSKYHYFEGNITDDYGFSSLYFVAQIMEGNKIIRTNKTAISIKKSQIENQFFFPWNFRSLNPGKHQSIQYFFEVSDNDGLNGPKTSRSEVRIWNAPTAQQLSAEMNEGSQTLKTKIENSIKLAKQIEKESKQLSELLLNKKELLFEDKKQVEQLLDKQKQLDAAMNEIKKLNEKNKLQNNENNLLNEELKEKQKQLENLFNQVLDEKTKELLNKLQQLMEQNRKDDTQQELKQMQLDNKQVKNELDRLLELYKQLEFEQSLQNKIDRLQDLAKQQQALAKQPNWNLQDQKDKQTQLNNEFKSLQKELKELANKNQALDRPNNFENPEKETNEIAKNQQESSKQLEQNQRQKATEKQEQAAEQMDQLAQQLQAQQQAGSEMDSKTNVQELRTLLQKLLNSSFEQEKLMLSIRQTNPNDPTYLSQTQQQKNIGNYMTIVADSLFSLSKRVPQLESTVNKEVETINSNIAKSIDYLAERRTAEANRSQQYTMTSMNNLALMLNEALEQLQNAMKNAKSGAGKPKQGMKQLQQMQEQLNKTMQQAKQQMEQQGNKGKAGKGQMSEEFARMAQQQQMLRNALEKINREENKNGQGKLGNLNEAIREMKQTELDLVNKQINQKTLERQKDLMVKLLDAEKAQKEQQEDEKRESNAAKQFPPTYQKMLDKFLKSTQSEVELLQKLPPNLNPYYKNKVSEYYKLLNLQQNK